MSQIAAQPFRLLVLVSLVTMHASAGTASAQLQLQTYVSGLTLPVGFVQDPANPAVQYVVEQVGRIRAIANGTLLSIAQSAARTVLPTEYMAQLPRTDQR